VRGLSENRCPGEVWRTDYRWLLPHYAAFGILGLVLALGYQMFGWSALVALTAPVAMMHLAIKQYVDQTGVYLNELRALNGRLSDSYEATLQALSRALDTRDEETEEHSQRVRRYTELIARRLHVPAADLAHVSRGALLHDIGKIGIPDAILLKPQKLSPQEHALMRKHPAIGYAMIAHIPFLAQAAQIVLHHHEAYDGTGYPSGLAGERIPLGARIFAVADTFDAMTSDRPYRKALPPEQALAEIRRCAGSQFDPRVVDALLAIPLPELLAPRESHPDDRLARDPLLGVALAGNHHP
jgi:putative nucleotidyltransferase with HDIG domain